MNEWIIQSRAHACQACERRFADKEHYYTLLQTNKHELIRLDICKTCWDAKHAKGGEAPKGFISQWQGIYHAPSHAVHSEPVQKENSETLLRKLIEANDPKYGPACYILAVMLERKRLLKVKEQFKREGTRVFIYEHPKSGDIFTITDPELQLNQLEAVQRDVGDLLANGFNPTPLVSEPQSPATEPMASIKPTEPTEQPSQPTENSEAVLNSEIPTTSASEEPSIEKSAQPQSP